MHLPPTDSAKLPGRISAAVMLHEEPSTRAELATDSINPTASMYPATLDGADLAAVTKHDVELPPVRAAVKPVHQRALRGGPEREVVYAVARRLGVADQGDHFLASLADQLHRVEHP